MHLFSTFCNICYKTDDTNLKDISEENLKHLKDNLITFVGHPDIIKHNVIYLCQLCCEELTRLDKFREVCFNNLIQLRQRYFNMKSKLESEEDVATVKNTLEKFVQEEVLRRNSLEKSNSSVSISTELHKIVKSSVDLNKKDSVSNKQLINLQPERNECSDLSVINSVAECDKSRVAFTNEVDMNNEMLRRSTDTNLENFVRESNEEFDVSNINNDNERYTPQIEFVKEEFDLNTDIESHDSAHFTLNTFENESNEYTNLAVKVPDVNNTEGNDNSVIESTNVEIHVKKEYNATESWELDTTENKSNNDLPVAFEFVNVCAFGNMQNCGDRDITTGKDDSTVFSFSGNRSTALMNKQLSHPQVKEQSNISCSTVPQSGVYELLVAGPHTCAVCSKTFRTSTCLIRHERTHKSYNCTVCNKTFTTSSTLNTHKRTHSGDRPFTCPVCNKSFTQKFHLTVHERTHRGERPYKCTYCNKSFSQKPNFVIHERIHTGDRPYKCTFCDKTFRGSAYLTVHERTHSGDRPHKCSVCNKAFTQFGSLTIHERLHSGDRPYKCTLCGKGFTKSSHLIVHERTHSGNKPYKCSICNKEFIQSSTLTTHERTHNGDRPYKCTVCNKGFMQSSNLVTHERIHSGARPYNCTICNKTFAQKSNLITHELLHASDTPCKLEEFDSTCT